jgi:hypothetical protein
VVEGDDGKGEGERLLWVIERINFEFYDMLEDKKMAYQRVISKQKPLSKARYSEDPVDFEVSLILSYFPTEDKCDVKDAISSLSDPFLVLNVLSTLKANLFRIQTEGSSKKR